MSLKHINNNDYMKIGFITVKYLIDKKKYLKKNKLVLNLN